MSKSAPILIMVIGVSGSGKSTVAKAVASKLDWAFVEADDFHSQKNRQHMASGRPLTDAMRAPWIEALSQHLNELAESHTNSVLAFSGLRAAHRAVFRSLPFNAITFCLQADAALIGQRMNERARHFMPASLLSSQIADFEDPFTEPATLRLNVNGSVDQTVQQLFSKLYELIPQGDIHG